MKYGIELEFFVTKNDNVVPAYQATHNLDGNPVVGELRTKVFKSISECIFDLKRLMYLEKKQLNNKGFNMLIQPEVTVNDEFIRKLRKNRNFYDMKGKMYSDPLSIYGEAKTHILPVNKFKAALQINFSKDRYLYTTDKGRRINGGVIFNYVDLIRGLDIEFKEEIKATKRVSGIYSIKDGEVSERIEYRSLPNNVNLFKVIESLNTK